MNRISYEEFLEIIPLMTTERITWLIANLRLELQLREIKNEDNKKQ